MIDFDMPVDTRNVENAKVQRHGLWQTYNYLGKRSIHMDGSIMGSDSADYFIKRQALMGVFMPNAELGYKPVGSLVAQFYGVDEEVSIVCDLDGYPDAPMAAGPSYSTYSVALKAADPRWYGTQVNSTLATIPVVGGGLQFPLSYPLSYGSLTSGGTVLVTNDGNAPTYISAQIFGPCYNPSLTYSYVDGNGLVTLYEWAMSNFFVADGRSFTVNFLDRTVLDDLNNNLYSSIDSGSDWFVLQPGPNSVSFSAQLATSNCHAVISWQNAYML